MRTHLQDRIERRANAATYLVVGLVAFVFGLVALFAYLARISQ